MYAAQEVSSKFPMSFPKRIGLLIQEVWLHARNFGVKSFSVENPVGILLLTSIDSGSGSVFLCEFCATFYPYGEYYSEIRDVYFVHSLKLYS